MPEEATPVPPTRTQSIIFYDLTEIEKTCPGYQEFTGFRQTVSQVKITCTAPGVETVYFVDLDNLGGDGHTRAAARTGNTVVGCNPWLGLGCVIATWGVS